jgi:hypothetical protein
MLMAQNKQQFGVTTNGDTNVAPRWWNKSMHRLTRNCSLLSVGQALLLNPDLAVLCMESSSLRVRPTLRWL